MRKTIENSYLNSFRWYTLCDAITSLDRYKHNISSMQFYLPVSSLCEAVATGKPYENEYDNVEEDNLGL